MNTFIFAVLIALGVTYVLGMLVMLIKAFKKAKIAKEIFQTRNIFHLVFNMLLATILIGITAIVSIIVIPFMAVVSLFEDKHGA